MSRRFGQTSLPIIAPWEVPAALKSEFRSDLTHNLIKPSPTPLMLQMKIDFDPPAGKR